MRLTAPLAEVHTLDRLIDVRRDVRKLRDSQAFRANAVAPKVRFEIAFIRRGELEPVMILIAGPVPRAGPRPPVAQRHGLGSGGS